jgi:pimeloyl-ACP methyl ester carboxylesterase
MNRNRLSVRICRGLAELGYAGLRFDYHGVGESTGSVDQFRLDRPFVEDVTAAVRCLGRMGVERVVLAGSCFGSRNALCAADELDNVDAVILIAAAFRDYVLGELHSLTQARRWSLMHYVREALRPSQLRGLFHGPTRRTYAKYARGKLRVMGARIPGVRRFVASRPIAVEEVAPTFETPLRRLVERGVAVRFIYGADDHFLEEFKTAAAGRLADVLEGDRTSVGLTVLPGRLHGFTTVASQDAVVEEIVGWVAARQAVSA